MTNLNKSANLLDRLYMAAPCSVGWENMQGNDRVRFCSVCSKNVFNISDMTKSEAEGFLNANGATVCMRMYQRADGTIINDNCPIGLRKLRNGARLFWRSVATLVGFCLSVSSVLAQGEKTNEPATQLSRMTIQIFDGRPGIRECEQLPSFETLTTGKHSLLKDKEIVIHNGAIAIVIEENSHSASQANRTRSYYDLWDQFTANNALKKAREFATQGDLKTANSFYKLLMKFFEAFDVYEVSEKTKVTEEYVEFLKRWNKPKEADELRKELATSKKAPKVDRVDVPIRAVP